MLRCALPTTGWVPIHSKVGRKTKERRLNCQSEGAANPARCVAVCVIGCLLPFAEIEPGVTNLAGKAEPPGGGLILLIDSG